MKIKSSLITVALLASLLSGIGAAHAADEYSLSLSPRTENVNANTAIAVTPNNLPTGVGIYALLCLDSAVDGDMATDSAARPVICDQTQALWIVRPDSAWASTPGVSVATANLLAKASFDGKVSRMASEVTPVNCRVDDCVVYIRPDHLSTGQTWIYDKYELSLLPSSGLGLTDFAVFSVESQEVAADATPDLTYFDTAEISVTTDSELPVTLSAANNNCAVIGNEVRALFGSGVCEVRATTLGDNTYDPLNQVLTFKLRKIKQTLLVLWPNRFNHKIGDEVVASKKDFKTNVKSARNLVSRTPNVCTVSETGNAFTIEFNEVGICRVTAISAHVEGRFKAASVKKSFGVKR